MTPVMPTVRNRITALDVCRGVAILGILLANITAFGGPELGNVFVPPESNGSWLDAVRHWFVAGKFRGMLAILFGYGLWMQYMKRSKTGSWPKSYLKRTLLLSGIGLIHLLLIWYGDILFIYSLTAFVAAFMVKIENLRLVAGILLGLSLMLGLVTAFAGLFMGGMGEEQIFETVPMLKGYLAPDAEVSIYMAGTYLDQVVHRLVIFALEAFNIPFIILSLLGLFLVGVIIARLQLLTPEGMEENGHLVRKLLLFCFGLGIPLNALPLLAQATGNPGVFDDLIEIGVSPLLALGYLLGVAWLVNKGLRLGALEKIGKMALSSYLLQSVLCTTFFYSWGFNFFGELTLSQLLSVAVGVWVINALFAYVWLGKFAMGPVEWAWRSLSMGRRAPLLKKELTPPPIAPAS